MAAMGYSSSAEPAVIVRAVTVIMGTVVGLTFWFGFGNVLDLAFRLGAGLGSAARRACGGPLDPGASARHPAPRAYRRVR